MAAANVYSPAPGDKLIPGAQSVTEFFGFTGDCIEAAGEILYSWGQGKAPSGQHINRVVGALQQAGQAGPQGVTSLQAESAQLRREGVPNTVTGDWLGAVNQYAAVRPIELGVTRAYNLPGDLGHVSGHGITVEGRTAGGDFIISDPNSQAAKSRQLDVVTRAQLAAAQPWGAIVPSQSSGAIGGGPGGSPDWWQTISGTATSLATGGVVNLPGSAQGAAQQAATAGNPLDPATWISAIGGALRPVALNGAVFLLALVAIGAGVLLLFWDPISSAAKEGTKAAATAAVAA